MKTKPTAPYYPIDLECTFARHKEIGINAVVNARGGVAHLNHCLQDDVEMVRDARRISDRILFRTRFYQFNSKFFRRHAARFAHLIADRND